MLHDWNTWALFCSLHRTLTCAPDNLKVNKVTGQLTSNSEKKLQCLVKNKMCNKETIVPYVTPGAQLTNKVAITLVILPFLVLNSPAKLPWEETGGFPTLKAMNSSALPLAELHTLKAQNIIQRKCCKKIVLQSKESIVKQSPESSLNGSYNHDHRAFHRKYTGRDYLLHFFPPWWYIIICHLHRSFHARLFYNHNSGITYHNNWVWEIKIYFPWGYLRGSVG